MRHSEIRRVTVRAILAMLAALLAGAAGTQGSTAPIGTGSLPSAVTDQDGMTHAVWLEGHGNDNPDTVAYCRIPRGSTTCANIQHLVPRCNGGVPATSWHRPAGGYLDGDAPKVAITPFGDVYIITDGVCPWGFQSTVDPWKDYHWFMRQIVLHFQDDGDTFVGSAEGQGHAAGWRQSADRGSAMTEGPATVYDASDSRIVTVEAGAAATSWTAGSSSSVARTRWSPKTPSGPRSRILRRDCWPSTTSTTACTRRVPPRS